LDYRVLNAQYGDLKELEDVLVKNRFALSTESDTAVIIRQAALTLTKSPATGNTTGPDHLQRLFAYNHVLKQYGEGGLGNGAITDSLIKEAAEANIVSPVSSLIVLETQQDYDRFGIEKSKNSLSNATLKSTGAVPEPHEWVLIILFALLSSYLILKSKKGKYA
jgi:XrtN system VIT domain protein